MKLKSAIWVGAVVLVALSAFFGLFLYISHQDPDTYKIKVSFQNTRGLSRQSVVRMQGVNIGEVSDVAAHDGRAATSGRVARFSLFADAARCESLGHDQGTRNENAGAPP